MPKLSIITINFNNLAGLQKTMQSVFEQTFTDYEYIVIDGGSTDGSKEYIEQYADKLTYWVSEPDKGIYNAMNKGIIKANGNYLNFMNSGDLFCDKYVLEKLSSIALKDAIIFGNIITIEENKKIKKIKYSSNSLNSLGSILWGNFCHQSMFFHRKIFEKYGLYDEKYKIVSDWFFLLRTVGLSDEEIQYVNLDICLYDTNGFGSSNANVYYSEREEIINRLIHPKILSDYKTWEHYRLDIENLQKIKRNTMLNFIYVFIRKCANFLNK